MALYRVLVVDDSGFMRKLFSDIIEGEPEFTVVGTAATGKEAVEQFALLKPDAVTMDLEMPEMNGIEALQRIMLQHPVPVIMLSGISEDGVRETIRALQFGAFDFIRKPDLAALDIHAVAEQLISRLKVAVLVKRMLPPGGVASSMPPAAARSAVRPHVADKPNEQAAAQGVSGKKKQPKPEEPRKKREIRLQTGQSGGVAGGLPPKAVPRAGFRDIIAIGTSTGGPRALHAVLTSLPPGLPAPIVVVQHMPPKFTLSLAQRLDSFSALNVKEAAEGDRLQSGVVYIAPGGRHMEVAKDALGYRIRLTDEQIRGGHRPSVDVLFDSLLACPELARHIVLMTGMGSDGAEGMKALADQGVPTAIAEAEETCVVYGMPRSAVERGAAREIMPLHDIAPRLVDAVMN